MNDETVQFARQWWKRRDQTLVPDEVRAVRAVSPAGQWLYCADQPSTGLDRRIGTGR
jgi:hypothetical protein